MVIEVSTPRWVRFLAHPAALALAGAAWLVFMASGFVFVHFYNKYAAIIDSRLKNPLFTESSVLYSAPETIRLDEPITPEAVMARLRRAGYGEGAGSPVGEFTATADRIEVHPGPQSFQPEAAVALDFADGRLASILNLANQAALESYPLEPEVLTSLYNRQRVKRELVHYDDLPPLLVRAVLDTEDRDFFTHGAVAFYRIPACFYKDVRNHRLEQGCSTITMQVARNLLLTRQKTWSRKLTETLIALELEQRLTKQQIFEIYANQVPMGQRGSYAIVGLGEAASAFFGTSVDRLTLDQCALLAGIIHGPSIDSPYTHPDNARSRRGFTLEQMTNNRDITPAQRAAAAAAPLKLAAANIEASDAPYFVDMVRDRISDAAPDSATESYRIYTTLDPDLQAIAAASLSDAMKGVDKELTAWRAAHHDSNGRQMPQAAMIVLDPHTGDVLALVGGRNYTRSQLDHINALRPTGSIFKPFVYAAALQTGLDPGGAAVTETTALMDEQTTFPTLQGPYSPKNFEDKYFGPVTLRFALANSLNNATISLAMKVGLERVTDLAHAAGISSARPTPSEAIGTYRASPLQMAEAYTVFANGGVRMTPRMVLQVDSALGETLYSEAEQAQPVLDPKIAFMVTDLMQSVLAEGTGIRVHEVYDFDLPAAGKTGTSHDAWFAGYTSNLLCVVWVGLDDYKDIEIEGAHAALPIWAEFMKKATALPAYSDVRPFTPPPGLVAMNIDRHTYLPAGRNTPPDQIEADYFLPGTQPVQPDRGLIGGALNGIENLFRATPAPPPPPPAVVAPAPAPAANPEPAAALPAAPAPAPPPPPPHKKRGLFGKIAHALGGGGNP